MQSKSLKKNFIRATIVLLIALAATVTATFAWYIFQTSGKTTKVKMAAGTSTKLEISNTYDGVYSSSAALESECKGTLNPVSTDQIVDLDENGEEWVTFQKVYGYTDGSDTDSLLAKTFKRLTGDDFYNDYYKTTLYLRTTADKLNIYIADISYDQNDASELLSTALRVGFVVHEPGQNQKVILDKQYIVAINPDGENPEASFNTYTETQEHKRSREERGELVLDHTKTDGSVVNITDKLMTPQNYCIYDKKTGKVSLPTADRGPLFTLEGGANPTPVQVDVYIYMEGCDDDCTGSIGGLVMKNISISFGGLGDE